MEKSLRVLLVEDSQDDAVMVLRAVKQGGYEIACEQVDSENGFRTALVKQPWDIIISDYSVPGFGGLKALDILKESGLDIPFIMVSGVLTDETAVEVMKAGAHDYVLKRNLTRLPAAIEREIRDCEVRKRSRLLEDQLRRNQKLDALASLSAGVAHDFNNLLMVIIGYSELRVGQLPEGDAIRSDFEEILKAAKQASLLTDHLLAFSSMQAAKPITFEVNDFIQKSRSMLQLILKRGIELEIRPGASAYVKMDYVQLQQVLVSLIANARDAMPHGGKITLETGLIRQKEMPAFSQIDNENAEKEFVFIAVRDTGCGISNEMKQHLFEPVFSEKGGKKKISFGLATAYGIMQQAGGLIHVESEPDIGSIFYLYIPLAAEDGQKAEVTPSGVGSAEGFHRHETILVVDDEPAICDVLSSMLLDLGYNVLKAAGPEDALRLTENLMEKDIHLLLTDVVMPGMNGKKLAEIVCKQRPQMRVVFTSGYNQEEKNIVSSGHAFLPKPIRKDILAKTIREILNRKV